jgi:hypothetical protein
MVQQPAAYEPHLLEAEAQTVWKARKLPPAGGIFGPPDGSIVRQFEGSFTPQDATGLVAHRAVAADVDARYLTLAGRRAVGTLRSATVLPGETEPTIGPVLERLGVWTGGNGPVPWDSEDRSRGVQTMVGRLAHRGVVVSRDLPLRVCPTCAAPRSPERIIYQEEEGDTYLVRFDLPWNDQVVHALAWVDAPWRLLGTSAVLFHPELPYVVARYRRKDVEELILTSRSSVDRFRSWMPGATLEVLEEHPGRFFEGRPYVYPLRSEFPTGGALSPPAGTVIAVTDVTDTGTGIVLLVPGHGSTDAAIAEAKGVAGWPLITPRGQLDLTLMHKYAGLDLPTGSEFIVRDLTENGAIFAHLRVRRGVPHCAVCGSPLLWMPGRAWCLEPGRLPADRLELYRRLLPNAPALGRVEVAPWPVSEAVRTSDAGAVALLECSQCERLEALDGPVACPCGGKRYPVGRRLVPSAAGALAAWARTDPIPVTDSVHLYVGERRRVPVVVHHLMAMSGLDGTVGDVGITLLPTVTDADLRKLLDTHGADAVRAAFVRASGDDGATGTFRERCAQERDRLARFWSVTRNVLALVDPATVASFTQPISDFLGELEAEDLALLARWERTRVRALADYDHWTPANAHRRVFRFLDTDLSEYRDLVQARLDLKGMPTPKRSALRTLTHVLRSGSVLLGPIIPHLSEVIHRRLTTGRVSFFEGSIAGADRALLNDERDAAWDRWRSLILAVRRFRHQNGLAPGVTLPMVAILLSTDDRGDRFRADRPVLERLLGAGRVEVGSPREPWLGRQRQLRPVESEIQRYYPSQATQIVHLLQRMPVRKAAEAGTDAELSLVIQGLPRRVFPSMVEYSDTLPPRVVPCPWSPGELYVELPEGAKHPARVSPPLSSDAFWLVRRLDRRLRSAPYDPTAPLRVAIVSVTDPLATELRAAAEPLSRYLGLKEFRVLPNVAETPPPGRLVGRTRTGARWWVHVPGLTAPRRRTKRRPGRPRSRRVPVAPPGPQVSEIDYSSEEVAAHGEAVRALGLELDELLGAPLLGPTKVARAWEQGLTSVEEYRSAPFETLEDLPGFGRSIAGALVVKLGGTAPPPPPRVPRSPVRRLQPPDGHPAGPAAPWAPPPLERASPPGVRIESVLEPAEMGPRASLRGPSTPELPHPPVPAPMTEEPPTEPPASSQPSPPAEESVVREASHPMEIPAPPEPPVSPVVAPPLVPPPPEQAPLVPDASAAPPTGKSAQSEPIPPMDITLAEEEPPLSPGVEPAVEIPSVTEAALRPPPEPASVTEVVPEPSTAPQVPPAESSASSGAEAGEPTGASGAEALSGVELEPIPEATPPAEPSPETPGEMRDREVEPTGSLSEPPPPAEPPTEVPGIEPTEAVELPPAETLPTARTTEAEGASVAAPSVEMPPPEPTIPEPAANEPVGSRPANLGEMTTAPAALIPSSEESGVSPASGPEPTTAPEPSVAVPSEPSPSPAAPSMQAAEVETVLPLPPEEVPLVGEVATAPEAEVVPPPTSAPPEVAPELSVPLPPPSEEAVPEPVLPPPEPTPSGVELDVGTSILASLQPFLDATAAGHRGVCIVRESPERITAHVGSRPVEVYWLTNLGRGKTVKPNDLPGLLNFLTRALEEDRVMAFFLEGIEYLVRIHGAEALLARLAEFDRLAREHDARIWVHVTADLLAASDLERILAAFGTRNLPGEGPPAV